MPFTERTIRLELRRVCMCRVCVRMRALAGQIVTTSGRHSLSSKLIGFASGPRLESEPRLGLDSGHRKS